MDAKDCFFTTLRGGQVKISCLQQLLEEYEQRIETLETEVKSLKNYKKAKEDEGLR